MCISRTSRLSAMRFHSTTLDGVVLIEPDWHHDERGRFGRVFCEDEFAAAGLPQRFRQCNLSTNPREGTLRGMHVNVRSHWESKLVRCVRGAVFDVMVDVRPESPTYCRWYGVRLDADEGRALYAPEGCAHGFLTLEPGTDVYYHMGSAYAPGAGRGYRWDDPTFDIRWPATPRVISDRDATYPDFDAELPDRSGR